MCILKKTINGVVKEILEVHIYDEDDITEIKSNYASYENVEIELGMLRYLKLFSNIKTLILTGGILETDELECLYEQKELENLILDYEETDSDTEGIEIKKFPKIKYVLSRSNLNIYKISELKRETADIKIEILNYYQNGKPQKILAAPTTNIYQENKFLLFSTESKEPASVLIMKILNKFNVEFEKEFREKKFSEQLDKLAIIPICMSEDMIEQGFGKERKYVSIKKRYADVRFRISYEEFVMSNKKEQFLRENIEKVAKYVATKDPTFKLEEFLDAIKCVCRRCNN